MSRLNETHDPALTSWVASANRAGQDFTIQNLPFGVFRRAGSDEAFRGGVAIGDEIVDLAALAATGVIEGEAAAALAACTGPMLNDFMALGQPAWSALRLALSRALRTGSALEAAVRGCLVAQAEAEYAVPARIGDYTDFYTSIHHATNVGRLFRPDNPLLPNYKWVPIGYHGRASSIGVSGQAFYRPLGQTMPPGAERPNFGSSQRLDYELELGIFIGQGNQLGSRIALDDAESHVFGLCLLNDWSARDLQAWEYQPLGPFLAKNFATTISPWIVTLEALAPFRTEWTRPAEDPQPLPYLESATLRREGAFDIQIEAWLETSQMRKAGTPATRLSHSSFRHSYWTVSQMVTHHTVNGCGLQPGDLLGSGTESGPTPEEAGSLLELTIGGKQSLTLPNGETRRFLEDGDAVILRGYCEQAGAARIGFGEAVGRVLPAQH
ncbi:fumarylacetoacetase [Crenobacter sp. SG2305]|uniref:fumarylacetoacetase n=1 Tax=Crenobacter oryzisoli TaxID=3056844 RepID=UPI0025AB4B61|nr:fumarylacetoacetase [Crenobacter sp. SG2305]MDN0082774.1 fumarylacetoacetase [Crenobacter sp. SG2305]MDN0082792.1 fumarylacetoacetase [Crenobacter sp. SG2305]